jgi:hypothetical protein
MKDKNGINCTNQNGVLKIKTIETNALKQPMS